jgi:hypothetical protein
LVIRIITIIRNASLLYERMMRIKNIQGFIKY